MNLLKFVELQKKDTILHKIPIPIKATPFVLTIILWVINFGSLSLVLHIGIAISCALAICLILRAPRYTGEILTAFLIVYILGGFIYLIHGVAFIDYIRSEIKWLMYLLSMAYSLAFFLSTTSVEQLEGLLRRLKLPTGAIMTIIVTYNLIPAIYYEILEIIATQKARGLQLSKNPIKYAKQVIAIYLPLIFASLVRARNLEVALRARGYG